MKRNNALPPAYLMICCCIVFFASGCRKSERSHWETYKTTIYTPILLSKAEVFSTINGDPHQPIDSTGKIYVQGNRIFLNEVDKGIHVIDNSDPSHPVQTAFLKIPGNLDIAIESGILYADMYGDLLAVDVRDIHHVNVVANLQNIFAGRGSAYSYDSANIITGYTSKDTVIRQWVTPETNKVLYTLNAQTAGGSTAKSGSPGKAGSMARMVGMNGYLYGISNGNTVSIIDVRKPAQPVLASTMNTGWGIETIYPFEDKLFLGSSIGMYMFDLSNPVNPAQLGTFTHMTSCDPVIADGKYAFVTLHSGTACGRDINELDVLDIQDLHNPKLIRNYPMTKPGGLSKDGDLLFVCDGETGVKLLDVSDLKNRINYMGELVCEQPYDVITGSNMAIIVAKRGIYQFDYTDPKHARQLSFFHTGRQ